MIHRKRAYENTIKALVWEGAVAVNQRLTITPFTAETVVDNSTSMGNFSPLSVFTVNFMSFVVLGKSGTFLPFRCCVVLRF